MSQIPSDWWDGKLARVRKAGDDAKKVAGWLAKLRKAVEARAWL